MFDANIEPGVGLSIGSRYATDYCAYHSSELRQEGLPALHRAKTASVDDPGYGSKARVSVSYDTNGSAVSTSNDDRYQSLRATKYVQYSN